MAELRVSEQALRIHAYLLEDHSNKLFAYQDDVTLAGQSDEMDSMPSSVKKRIQRVSKELDTQMNTARRMSDTLRAVSVCYCNGEARIQLAQSMKGMLKTVFEESAGNAGIDTALYDSSWVSGEVRVLPDIQDWLNNASWTFPGIIGSAAAALDIYESIEDGSITIMEGDAAWGYKAASAKESIDGATYELYAGRINADAAFELTAGTISATVGVSCALAGADANVETVLGTTHANVEVGVAEASANTKIDLLAGDAYASGEIGVYAGTVEVSHSGSVAGVDVSVGASATVGVGAHLDVGIQGGQLNVDIGAALGIGASVNFSVDVGAIATSVSGAVESLFGWAF